VSAELAEEFPELALHHLTVAAPRRGRSPGTVRRRLAVMSDRFTGPKAVQVRQTPIPWAYRVFFRQIGIDPDDRRTPIEQVVLERMKWGGFRSAGLLEDALLVATVETGVPVIGLDAGAVEGRLGLRLAAEDESLPGDGSALIAGQIVLADESAPVSVLFGEVAEGHGVGRRTERVLLVSVRVKGVPMISVEEAMWTAAEMLEEGPD